MVGPKNVPLLLGDVESEQLSSALAAAHIVTAVLREFRSKRANKWLNI
jgi:hypothetical protein